MSSAGIAVSHFRVDQVLSPARRERSQSLHYFEKSFLIYLTFQGSSVMPMRVLESDSIASLKLRMQSCKGFAVKNQKLVFDGRELARNDWLVRDYGLSDGIVIHLVIRLSEFRLIIVNTACGKKFEFQAEQNRSVAYIKDQIAKKGGKDFADIKNQQLVYDGEELDDRLLINDISKNNESIINLSICMSAKVRTMPFEKNFNLSFDARRSEGTRADDLSIVTSEPFDKHAWIEPVIVNPKVKLSPMLKELINATDAGIKQGIKPVLSSEGSGGAYFMKEGSGRKNVAVFKPIDEEPMAENNPRGLPLSLDGEGLKRGTRVGEGALREVAAYILDHPASGFRSFLSDEPGFSGVPPTIMAQCLPGGNDSFETKDFKIGSLQKFVESSGSCEDIGPRAFPVEEVHKIAVLDLRLVNADRHAGNILFCREGEAGKINLVPIDHGYCLPEHFEDCTFDWLFWPQARQPFDSRTLDYIKSLDAEKDLALLKFYGWEPSLNCSRTFRISTMLLKKAAERRLTPYDIGNILCRVTVNKKSKIEEMIFKAMDSILPGSSEAAFMEIISEVMDTYLDKLTQ